MAQQVIPATQLVPRFHTIRRCNNYAKLQSIPCSPECKIVGQILLVHPLSYALTATADVPVVVGYQGVVDKVSTFYMKNLAQPWQTMFKVFNHCLTTRTSGHDQTKINIHQMFHSVINRTNVNYAALIWWDFMNNVNQKKEAIQYPRFIKLIIADLMKKFLDIPQMIDEDYYSIKDDIPLGKKRKQRAGESSSILKSLKITIRQQKVVEGEKDDDDSENKLEPESHKDNPDHVDDDDDKDVEKVYEEEGGEMGSSLETRTEEM
ncbi:hypothetical protein Tco_1445268 [Tanacetum coccineum]